MLPWRSKILAEAISAGFRYTGYVTVREIDTYVFVNSAHMILKTVSYNLFEAISQECLAILPGM